ncbi:MAG TPA: helix-turn-helix domain-containing protein [Clostridia bacterium]|nr:helix-turn-helix domain-containing protein [Clostridia bacterium]
MYSHKSREEKLEALLEVTQILNSTHDTDSILHSLLELSIKLIDGGDAGCIFLYNKRTGFLEMKAYVGMGDSVKDVKMLPGESMTGIAFERKEAMFFPDSKAVRSAMGTMSKRNNQMAVDGNVVASNIHSSICCPLRYLEDTIGVLVIDNFTNKATLMESDVALLKAVSVQATIAIVNSLNYERELKNNQKLARYNKIIESQRNKYKFSTQVHGKFTDMVLNGSSLDDIIEEVKFLTKKNVFLVNPFYNITNHTYIKPLPFESESLRPLLIQKLNKHAKTLFETDSGLHCFSFPITVNQETMGWLCLISKSAKLVENEIIAAERSATILAIEILKQNELKDLEQSLKGDFLDSLLTGVPNDYLLKCSENYHFNMESSHRILLVKFMFESPSGTSLTNHEKHVRNCLKRYYTPFDNALQSSSPGSIALLRHHYIVCILESSPLKDNLDVEEVLNIVKSKYHQNYSHEFKTLKLRIGISDAFDKIGDFRNAYESARHTVKMIESSDSPIVSLYFKDIEVKRFLLANEKEHLRSYYNKVLAPLLDYDNNSRNDFIETLEIYLKSNCNWSESKKLLHIHGNTLTYRLNRISEIMNMDLKNYQDRLRLQIAFEIQELLK